MIMKNLKIQKCYSICMEELTGLASSDQKKYDTLFVELCVGNDIHEAKSLKAINVRNMVNRMCVSIQLRTSRKIFYAMAKEMVKEQFIPKDRAKDKYVIIKAMMLLHSRRTLD